MKTITTPHGKIMEDEIEKDFQLQVHNEYGAISKEFFRVDAAREWHKKGYKAARVYSEEAIELAIEFGLQYAFDQKMTEQYQKDKLKFIQSLNQEPIEDKVNNLSDEVNNLSAECFNMLRKLNPKGGIREFVRMSVEFGFKAQQKNVYSEADLTRFDSDKFIENVCLSFRHDYGLMAEQDRQRLRFDCKEWMRAITNNWEYFKT